MREMKDSGIEWIGEIPVQWNLVQTKRFKLTTPIISKKPVKPGKSRDRGTEFTTKLLLLD